MSSSGRRQLRLGALGAVLAASLWAVAPAGARVLLVDASPARHHEHRSHGHRYTTIQDAVDAARPGDWILIAPGDYHERGDRTPAHAPTDEAGAGVMITTPRIHLRGLDRNRVVVDGTLPGSPQCGSAAPDQDFGPAGGDGRPLGRNGVEVFKASGVTVENLTVCNFLDGAGGGGNQIWFNGGDGSGTIGMGRYRGAWLSATSTFYGGQGAPAGSYGIFASNAGGPGLLADTYASNMDDSSYYIGACPDCHAVLTRGHAENSALGYSGTNSGGHLVVERSEWDQNKTGIVTNSQNNDDAPSPQDGRCPGTQQSCTFFRHNDIHDNNNPNVPSSGTASLGPPGTGIVVAGGRYDTVSDNRITHNGAWGVLVVPFPDDTTPPLDTPSHCQGGQLNFITACFYDDWANEVTGNRFAGNGFFDNPTNGDMGDISGLHTPGNCFHNNHGPNGAAPTSAPGDLQATHGTCGVPNQGAGLGDPLSAQVICATEAFGPCPPKPGMSYPRATQVQMLPLPRQRSMHDPCDDVPSNGWCDDDNDDD